MNIAAGARMNIAAGARGYKMQFLVSWDTGGLSQERFENRNANKCKCGCLIPNPAGSDRVCFKIRNFVLSKVLRKNLPQLACSILRNLAEAF